MDYARARTAMVESQVRTADVTDPAIAQAMRTLAREQFTPAALAPLAYADLDLEIAPGRFLLRPRDLAKLLQALAPKPGERALEIAGLSGYGAAVLARCGLATTLIEGELPDELTALQKQASGAGVAVMKGPNADGWLKGAPYDVIAVNGAVEIVPDAWFAQLAEGGRLGVIVRNGAAGAARIYTKANGAASYRAAFDAAPPVIAAFARAPSFQF